MRFKALTGKEKFLNIEANRIDWDKPSLSKFQFNIKQFLKQYWKGMIVYEEMPLLGTRLRLDFYNANKKIAVECNGKQHGSYNKFFHGGNTDKYLSQIQRDDKKYRWCELNNIILVEIEPNDELSPRLFEKFGVEL